MNATLLAQTWQMSAQVARCWLGGSASCEPVGPLEHETAALQRSCEYALRGARFPLEQRIVLAMLATMVCALLLLLAQCCTRRPSRAAATATAAAAAAAARDESASHATAPPGAHFTADDDDASEVVRAAHLAAMAALQDRLDAAEGQVAQLAHTHARQIGQQERVHAAQLEEERTRLHRAQTEHAQTQQQLAQAIAEIQSLRNESTTAATVSSPRNSAALSASQLAEVQQQHAASLASLNQQLEQRDGSVRALTEQLRAMEAKIAAQDRAHAAEARATLSASEARHRAELDASRSECASLRAQLSATAPSRPAASQRDQITTGERMQRELEAAQSQLAALHSHQPSDPAALVARQLQAHQLEQQVRDLRASIAAHQKRVHADQRVEELERRHQAILAAAETESIALRQTLSALEIASVAKDESIDQLGAQVIELQARLDEYAAGRVKALPQGGPSSLVLAPDQSPSSSSEEALGALLSRVRATEGTAESGAPGFTAALGAIRQLQAQNEALQVRLRESEAGRAMRGLGGPALLPLPTAASTRSSTGSDGSHRVSDAPGSGWAGRAPRLSVSTADEPNSAPPAVQIKINDRSERSNALLTAQQEEDELHRVFRRRLSAMQAPPPFAAAQAGTVGAAAAAAKMQQEAQEEQLRHVHELVAKFEQLEARASTALPRPSDASAGAAAAAAATAAAPVVPLTPQQQMSRQLDRLSLLHSSVERNLQQVAAENARLQLRLAGAHRGDVDGGGALEKARSHAGPTADAASAAASRRHSPSHSWGDGSGRADSRGHTDLPVLLDDDEKERLRAQADEASAQADSAHAEVETLRRQLSEARRLLHESGLADTVDQSARVRRSTLPS